MKHFLIVVGVISAISTSILGLAQANDNSKSTPRYKIMEIRAENGNENSAAFFDAKNDQVVIFVPGAVFDKESWFFLAERLQGKHIASLSLDGKTPGEVLSAINVMKKKGFKKIALVGGSMGGAAVLDALHVKIDPRVNKVVALAPAGGKPINSQKIKKLFIVAKNDSLGLYPVVEKFYERSSNPKKFVAIDGSEHAQHLFKGSHGAEVTRIILNFLAS